MNGESDNITNEWDGWGMGKVDRREMVQIVAMTIVKEMQSV